MTGAEALIKYGYTDQLGTFVHVGRETQRWLKKDDGWLRYEPDGSLCPFRVSPEASVQGGLNFKSPAHEKYFDWVWPDEVIARIYSTSVEKKRHRIRFWMKD
jgi:hypothetical protein